MSTKVYKISLIKILLCFSFVLFDTKTKREINDDNNLINIMVEHYKNWFMEYKRTGKLPYYRFLNEGLIRWWGMQGN